MEAGPTCLHRETPLDEETATGHADMGFILPLFPGDVRDSDGRQLGGPEVPAHPLVLLYHVLLHFSTPTTFPVSLSRLAQLRDEFWGEGNPARSMRVSADALQNPSVTPIGNRRDVDIEQFCRRQCGVASIASLPSRTESRTLRTSQGNVVGGTNPVDF